MGNPNPQTIPEWTWTKVATNIIGGVLHRLTTTVFYYQTYRLTGEAAPAAPTIGEIPEEAVKIFENSTEEIISSTAPIDVYIMCANADSDSLDEGKIRVDI